MKTRSLILATLSAVVLASCGSSKPAKKVYESPQGEQIVEVPCTGTKFLDDNKHFRATGTNTSAMLQVAKNIAISNAKAELAGKISTTVQTVTQNYYRQRNKEMNNSTIAKIESMTVQTVNQTLNNTKTICDITTRVKTEGPNKGKYVSYLTMEISVEDITTEMGESLSEDEELRIDYEYEKFKEQFELEMAKRSNSN